MKPVSAQESFARHSMPPWSWVLGLGIGGFLSWLAHTALASGWPLPQCWFRQLAGIPCLTCGSTRSLAAWAQFDLARAFLCNPLFFLACAATIVWTALRLIERFTAVSITPRFTLGHLYRGWRIGALLVLLNWLYLCISLPKTAFE